MKRLWIVLLLTITIGCAFLAQPAFAIFGIGDVVFDPSNYAEAIQQLLQMEQQYVQLVQTYQTVRGQFDHLVWMAKRVPVDMAARYKAVVTPWRSASAGNTYGTTERWVLALNTGMGVESGYSEATQPLAAYDATLANIPSDQLQRVKTNYATVELTDGANLDALDTIGRLRSNAPGVEEAIRSLEDDSFSPDPAMNTEIAVLNKINAANLLTIRNGQDANKLLVALAEQQVIDAKRKRDAETQAINNHIRFMAEAKAVMAAQAAGSSEAMLAWRMP